ncbi:MAG: serine hydrolase [Candidatus Paceibacterota bacterium]
MNPNDENNFIIEENIPTTTQETTSPTSTFPILPHLMVLGVILFGLFATIIIPKTLSVLHTEKTVAVVKPATENTNSVLPAAVGAFDNMTVKGKAAYVWDINKQKALFAKNPDEALPLASITKLMTALVAYEILPDETPVTITKEASAQQSGGTLKWGEVFIAKDLANFALISSYNSAAFTLAASVGALLGDINPTEQFVTGMNLKAQDLNLPSLKFYNPTGLDLSTTEAGAYGNAKDVSLLVEYILLNYPEILDPTVKPNTRLYNNQGEYHEADNTNEIVRDIPNLLGSKTGYTDLAGGNLTVVFDAGLNHPIVITVLGSTHSERFADVKKLMSAAILTARSE